MQRESTVGILIILLFFLALTAHSLGSYSLYRYLKRIGKVTGYLDFMAYNWGKRNTKNGQLIFTTMRYKDEALSKARIFFIIYNVLLGSTIVLLIISFVMSE